MSLGRLEVLSSGDMPLDPEDALAEAEHRFANSLTVVAALVRAQARSLPPADTIATADVRTLLAGIEARLAAVGRLHRMLMRRGTATVELSDYLAEVASVVCEAFTDIDTVALRTDLRAEFQLSIKDAEAIGLIVSEALINALKHAASAKLVIASRRPAGGTLIIEIADSGPGLPAGWDARGSARKFSGIALMQALAFELNGRLIFDQSAGGLCVRLVLPAAAP